MSFRKCRSLRQRRSCRCVQQPGGLPEGSRGSKCNGDPRYRLRDGFRIPEGCQTICARSPILAPLRGAALFRSVPGVSLAALRSTPGYHLSSLRDDAESQPRRGDIFVGWKPNEPLDPQERHLLGLCRPYGAGDSEEVDVSTKISLLTELAPSVPEQDTSRCSSGDAFERQRPRRKNRVSPEPPIALPLLGGEGWGEGGR
jgi:hypothetical protein